MPVKLDIVTAEKLVYSDQVDEVVAPGGEGELGILPHHAPLMTLLKPGELLLKKGGEEISIAISGGFLEVRPDHVIVLADAAETEEIDASRAEAARKRAQERLTHVTSVQEKAAAEAALARAIVRLYTVEKLRPQGDKQVDFSYQCQLNSRGTPILMAREF